MSIPTVIYSCDGSKLLYDPSTGLPVVAPPITLPTALSVAYPTPGGSFGGCFPAGSQTVHAVPCAWLAGSDYCAMWTYGIDITAYASFLDFVASWPHGLFSIIVAKSCCLTSVNIDKHSECCMYGVLAPNQDPRGVYTAGVGPHALAVCPNTGSITIS